MKTSELQGAALDWAVTQCEQFVEDVFEPSENWADGGPIIEREKIGLKCHSDGTWEASHPECLYWKRGETPLVAAMRCYVASKLGDEIEIPEELR